MKRPTAHDLEDERLLRGWQEARGLVLPSPEIVDIPEMKQAIRAAWRLGILACDNTDVLECAPLDHVRHNGIDYVSPHGAVELCYCPSGACRHRATVEGSAFMIRATELHKQIFNLRKAGKPADELEAQLAEVLA